MGLVQKVAICGPLPLPISLGPVDCGAPANAKECNSTDILASNIRQETLLQTLIDEKDFEKLGLGGGVSTVCVDNAGVKISILMRFAPEVYNSENSAVIITPSVREFSSDVGVTWSTTPPTGIITPGACIIDAPDRQINTVSGCTNTVTQVPVSGETAKEVIIGGIKDVLNVRIVENCEPVVENDYKYVCNKTTKVYDLHIIQTIDGVKQPTVITPTTIVCDVPKDDFETQSYCSLITNTTWIRSVSFTETGVMTVLSNMDTGIACHTPTTQNVVTGGALPIIAGPIRSATALFVGVPNATDTSTVGGRLQAVSVTAFSVTNAGLVGVTQNQVVIRYPDGTEQPMMNNMTETFSVIKDADQELRQDYRITATGNAYAKISYTFI